ncbi:hypothetical protein PPNSA23_17610 [Phyllobacterium phragmitis]|uniref:Uncharacterized protein n=1 Tax=Phyllobacterium phragmitis TaxID=2670329 RepID=A0ABQ0GYU4_9HYPH
MLRHCGELEGRENRPPVQPALRAAMRAWVTWLCNWRIAGLEADRLRPPDAEASCRCSLAHTGEAAWPSPVETPTAPIARLAMAIMRKILFIIRQP